MHTDKKQVRSLLGGINYCCKSLPNLSRRIRPINVLLKQGATFDFTPAMETTVRAILHERAEPRTTNPRLLRLGRRRRQLPPPSASNAMPASMVLERPLSKNNPAAQSASSSTSAAPPRIPKINGHPATPRPEASSGQSTTPRASVAHPIRDIFGPQGIREHRQGRLAQTSRPALT